MQSRTSFLYTSSSVSLEKMLCVLLYSRALEYNKTHNIFSRETEEEVYKKDVLDCMPLVKKIKNQNTVLDLGSGGGFPGIVLSITKPQNPINLLEGSEKKCYFLKKIKHELSLENAFSRESSCLIFLRK